MSALTVWAAPLAAQQPQPADQVAPASSTPQVEQPNPRTDSKPHAGQAGPSDSPAPAAETPDKEMPPMDMGLDWSLSSSDGNQPGITRRIVTRKGQVSVVEIPIQPAPVLPVSTPAEPPSRVISDIPLPPTKQMAPPQDPLAGIPQK